MTSKTNLISKIENSEITEAQANAILEILNAGKAPKANLNININQAARKADFVAITSTDSFAKLQAEVVELRAANSIS